MLSPLYFGIFQPVHLGFRKRENWHRLAGNEQHLGHCKSNDGLTIGLDQRRWRLLGMTAPHKTVGRIAAWVLGILRMITVSRAWAKEVAMAKVIEFYIPKNFRKSFKWVPELQRGRILEFCPQTKKSA
jgi:hypothetical protein